MHQGHETHLIKCESRNEMKSVLSCTHLLFSENKALNSVVRGAS